MKWRSFCFKSFWLLTIIEVCIGTANDREIPQTRRNDHHSIAKRLWRVYDEAEARNLERRNLKEVAYDDANNDNVEQIQDIDEMSLGPEELQVDFDSPEYRKLALQKAELQGNAYDEPQIVLK